MGKISCLLFVSDVTVRLKSLKRIEFFLAQQTFNLYRRRLVIVATPAFPLYLNVGMNFEGHKIPATNEIESERES